MGYKEYWIGYVEYWKGHLEYLGGGGVGYLMVCVEYWRGLHFDLQPTYTAFAGGREQH